MNLTTRGIQDGRDAPEQIICGNTADYEVPVLSIDPLSAALLELRLVA